MHSKYDSALRRDWEHVSAQAEVNTAIFARDVAVYVQERWDQFNPKDVIVFLCVRLAQCASSTIVTIIHAKRQNLVSDLAIREAKGAEKVSCGETVVHKGVFGESVSFSVPLRFLKNLKTLELVERIVLSIFAFWTTISPHDASPLLWRTPNFFQKENVMSKFWGKKELFVSYAFGRYFLDVTMNAQGNLSQSISLRFQGKRLDIFWVKSFHIDVGGNSKS